MSYLTIIKYAAFFFPFIAFLFTTPFILMEYHKYGAISLFKAVITYLFIFYLICAYFLIILPLPKISEVRMLTTPKTQLIPFYFIIDFMKNSSFELTNINTYLTSLKESYFFVPVFNVVLTMPFGMFLRYFFEYNKKKTIWYTFLLSLFFELTQLSGLYFIYPRGYRLFDVDDLLLNTLGGFLGYICCKPFLKILPEIRKIKENAKEKGKNISGLRRSVALILDLGILIIIELLTIVLWKDNWYLSLSIAFCYYFIIPLFLNTSTLGEKFLKIETVDYHNERNLPRLLFRKILILSMYIIIPVSTCIIVFHIKNDFSKELIGLAIIGIIFLLYIISSIKYLFTNKEMLYEKMSKTKRVSTIK